MLPRWRCCVGFGLVSIVLYWLREYILYIVKAGHIAVIVHLIDGRNVPGGPGQIEYARRVVAERFAEATCFSRPTSLNGAIRAITGLIVGIAAFLPIPGLEGIVGFVNTVIGSRSPKSTSSFSATTSGSTAVILSRQPDRASFSMPRTARPW